MIRKRWTRLPQFSRRSLLPGAYEVARNADALLVLTEWPEFRDLDWKRIYEMMGRPLVIDGRNLLEPKVMTEHGFEYHSFGRPDPQQASGAGSKFLNGALPQEHPDTGVCTDCAGKLSSGRPKLWYSKPCSVLLWVRADCDIDH